MRDWINISPSAGLTGKALMRYLVTQVALEHKVSEADIMGLARHAKITDARLDAYARIYATSRFSYPQIGAFFGRDHSTIVHGVKRANDRALAQQEAA